MLVALVLVALVAVSTAVGFAWRASQGRVRTATGSIKGIELGSHATLLQLSSEYCAPCRATARVLEQVSTDGIRHVEVDILDRPDLVERFNVLQTPTTLVLDARGDVRARIGGAVRRELIVAELDKLEAVAA